MKDLMVDWWREGANEVTVWGIISKIDASGNGICRGITLITFCFCFRTTPTETNLMHQSFFFLNDSCEV